MPLLQIKLYHAVADVERSGGPREDVSAEGEDADHWRPMLADEASSLSTSADPPNLCPPLLSPHLPHHNVLARAAVGGRCGSSRRGAVGAVAAAAMEPAWGSGGGRCAGAGAGRGGDGLPEGEGRR